MKAERLPFLCRIQVDRDMPSLNELLRLPSARRGALGRITAQWRKLFWELQVEQLGLEWMTRIEVAKKHPQRRLELIRRCKRKLDPDGAVGGAKPIIDALKSINERAAGKTVGRAPGWFYDDTETYLDFQVAQIVTGEEPSIELILYGQVEKK